MKKLFNHLNTLYENNPLLKKRMRVMIIALSIIFGGIIGFNYFKAFMIKRFFRSFEMPAVTVSSVTAKMTNWQPNLEAIGTVIAINGVEINSETAGKVVKIHFESGQLVNENAPLVDLEDSIEQAELKFSQANLALKQINYQRQESLLKKGATPSSSVDEAKASLEQAQSDIEKISTFIRQKHITAPFSGKLGIRQVNLGEYLSPGQSKIVTLQSLDPLYLEFFLPEQNLKKIHVGQKILFRVDEAPGLLFTGKLSAIDAKVDTNTHNIRVQATIANCPQSALQNPNQDQTIQLHRDNSTGSLIMTCDTEKNTQHKIQNFAFTPGLFASLDIEQPSSPNTLILPSTAISYSLYGNSVFIISPSAHEKDEQGHPVLRVKRVFVTTGEQRGNFTVIKSGIKAHDLIVSTGELKLKNGTRVVINNDLKMNMTETPVELSE